MARKPFQPLAAAALLLALAATLAITLAVACSTPTARGSPAPAAAAEQPMANGPQPRQIVVAYPSAGVSTVGFHVAIQEGYLAEEGIEARMVVQSGATSAQTIAAKEVDFGMAAGALLAAYLHGAPLRNVFVQIDKPLYFLIAQPSIAAPTDLVGQAIGVAAQGDSTQRATYTTLRGLGVDPVQVSYVGNVAGQQAVAALQLGAVAAATVGPSVDLVAEQLGFHQVAFMGDYLDYLTAGLATHEATIADDPELVGAVVRANLKAHRFLQQNRVGSVEYLARFVGLSPDLAERAYDGYLRYLTRDGTSSGLVLQRILRDQRFALQAAGVKTRFVPVDEAFRLDFAREANDELDRAAWHPRS